MRYVIMFFYGICFMACAAYAQQGNKNEFIFKEGMYTKNLPNKLATDKSKYLWYFKKDSTFIIFWQVNNKVTGVRKGRWSYLGDSVIRFTYQLLRSKLLLRSTIEYKAETKESLDSIYFTGSIAGIDGNAYGGGSFILDNEDKKFEKLGPYSHGLAGGIIRDNGNFWFAIPRNIYHGSIGVGGSFITGVSCYPLSITTFPNYNYHTLHIKIPPLDSTNNINTYPEIVDDPDDLRYAPPILDGKIRKGIPDNLSISFITADTDLFLEILSAARKREPYLNNLIDELEEYLKKK